MRNDEPTYRSWRAMINRCTNPRTKDWPNYGGRGICICERWKRDYEAFIEDMGLRPPGREIGRINNDGPYTKDNCAWQTRKENGRNKRNNRIVKCNGNPMPLSQAIELTQKNKSAVEGFLHRHPEFSGDIADLKFRPPIKLSEANVRMIRSSPLSSQAVATLLGVSKSLVKGVRRGEIWKSIV